MRKMIMNIKKLYFLTIKYVFHLFKFLLNNNSLRILAENINMMLYAFVYYK